MKITLIIIKNQSNIHTCGVNCACKHLNYLVAIGLLYLLFSFWMMTITAHSYLVSGWTGSTIYFCEYMEIL